MIRGMSQTRVSYGIFRKGGENHLTPPTYQEIVPITLPLEKFKVFLNSCIPFCCNSCHFAAAVYAFTIILLLIQRGGGGSPPSPSPLYESLTNLEISGDCGPRWVKMWYTWGPTRLKLHVPPLTRRCCPLSVVLLTFTNIQILIKITIIKFKSL